MTNLLTGVSGITAMSPALSVSSSRVAFSVYEEDGYNIYALDDGTPVAGQAPARLARDAGVLPPRTTAEGTVAAYLRNDTVGLPSQARQASYETTGYKPRLSVDFVGQPTVGVGVDSFGTYVGGGISASFSDILGNHTVAGINPGHEPSRRRRADHHLPELIAPRELRRCTRFDTVRAARHRPGSRQ